MTIRKATFDDWELLLKWRNDEETRKNSHNTGAVDEASHKAWLKGVLANEKRKLFVAMNGDTPVGTVRADLDNGVYELSWTVAPDMRGKGIGKNMVKLVADELNTKVRAEVKQGNTPSVKIAEYAGMKLTRDEEGVLQYANY